MLILLNVESSTRGILASACFNFTGPSKYLLKLFTLTELFGDIPYISHLAQSQILFVIAAVKCFGTCLLTLKVLYKCVIVAVRQWEIKGMAMILWRKSRKGTGEKKVRRAIFYSFWFSIELPPACWSL